MKRNICHSIKGHYLLIFFVAIIVIVIIESVYEDYFFNNSTDLTITIRKYISDYIAFFFSLIMPTLIIGAIGIYIAFE